MALGIGECDLWGLRFSGPDRCDPWSFSENPEMDLAGIHPALSIFNQNLLQIGL